MLIPIATERIARQWDDEIVPRLVDYIRIPGEVAAFRSRVGGATATSSASIRLAEAMGARAADRRADRRDRAPAGTHAGAAASRCPGSGERTVLLYGHLDKQPEMIGWRADGGPWTPLIEDGKLYGRGGADDGYAIFAALSALGALQAQGVAHARCVGMIETCEESGSYDLPAYLEALTPRLGNVDLVVGLDSGCGDYERLWMTTSLRGLAAGTLTRRRADRRRAFGRRERRRAVVVSHRAQAARPARGRRERAGSCRRRSTRRFPPSASSRPAQAAAILGDIVFRKYPFAGGTRPMVDDGAEALLNRTWRPALSMIGADGLPAIADAGNVLRPSTSLKLSLRLPPTVDGHAATQAMKALLEADPPHGAQRVRSSRRRARPAGMRRRRSRGSRRRSTTRRARIYGKPAAAMGEGGTIPFMAMLGEQFPEAQFLITGVLGPAFECARAQRIPAHRLREAPDCLRRGGHCRARREPLTRLRASRRCARRHGWRNAGNGTSASVPAAMAAQQQPRHVEIERRGAAAPRPARRARRRRARCRASTSRETRARRRARRPTAHSRTHAAPATGQRGIASGASAAARRASWSAGASSPTHTPSQRCNCRAKQGPAARRSSPSRSAHSRCSAASSRSAARSDARDANGPYAPGSAPASMRGCRDELRRAVDSHTARRLLPCGASARLCAGRRDLTSADSRSSAPSSPAVSSCSMRRISCDSRRSVSLRQSCEKCAATRSRRLMLLPM